MFTSTVAFSEYDVSLAAGTSIGQGPFFVRVYKTAGGMFVCMYVCERQLVRVIESLSLYKNTVKYMYLSNNIFMMTAEILARSLANFNRQFNWRVVGSNPIWVSDFFSRVLLA